MFNIGIPILVLFLAGTVIAQEKGFYLLPRVVGIKLCRVVVEAEVVAVPQHNSPGPLRRTLGLLRGKQMVINKDKNTYWVRILN